VIAWVNAVGNLAGTVAPFIVGWVKDSTGSFTGGLFALACFSLMSALVTLTLPSDRQASAKGGALAENPAE
jgi:MFS transporter, ACS family, tartrate transporter